MGVTADQLTLYINARARVCVLFGFSERERERVECGRESERAVRYKGI